MIKPRISVIMASYNHAKYVRKAIESVLAQSIQDFEIVVTDDASDDDTVAEIRTIADARISLAVLPENRGACTAMNASIARAHGEFIAVLNSDDIFLPGKLSRQLRYLDENPGIAAVFTWPAFIGEEGGPFVAADHKDGALRHVPNRARHEWLRHFFFNGNALCHPSVMIRRQCLDEIGPYNPALAQLPDLEMWIRLLRHHEIHLIEEPLTAFRIRENNRNASAARPEVLVRDQWEWRKVLEQYLNLDDSLLVRTFPEIAGCGSRSARIWSLAELALGVGRPAHVLFALDAMYKVAMESGDDARYREFIGHTGSYDPFGTLAPLPFHRGIGSSRVAGLAAAPRIVFDGPTLTFKR